MSGYTQNEDGFLVNEYGDEIGWCNSCGEEANVALGCCDDGEIVGYEDD